MQVLQHVAGEEPENAQHGRAREAVSERVKPIEAARRLEIDRSSVSRYLKTYPELLGTDGKVDFAEFITHRRANLDVPDKPAREVKPAKVAQSSTRSRHSESKARLVELQVEREERAAAKEAGELVEAAAIGDALIEAATLLRDKLLSPDVTLCERLAAEKDPRLVRELINTWSRGCLEEMIQAIAKLDASPPQDGSSPPPSSQD